MVGGFAAQPAAIVQAGYPTLGTAGAIYVVRIVFDGSR